MNLCLWPLLCLIGLESTSLEAKSWWNNQPLRWPEDRTYLVLFFTTESKVEPLLPLLTRLDRRPEILVVGLSPEPTERVEAFVKKHQIRFLVGAGSRSHRRFGVTTWPELRLLSPAGGKPTQIGATAEALGQWMAGLPPELVSGKFGKDSPPDLLRQHSVADPVLEERLRAVRLLRQRLPPEEFMSFCDELLQLDPPDAESEFVRAVWRGEVAYERHLANPAENPKQPRLPPSLVALRAYRQSGTEEAAFWLDVRFYHEAAAGKSFDELCSDFLEKASSANPNDLLIRQLIAERLAQATGNAAEKSLRLQELLLAETDPFIRGIIVGNILEVCRPNDAEMLKFLEEELERESDIRLVRPLLEEAINTLRAWR